MREPIWIEVEVVKSIHAQQIREHGGLHGIRDEKLLYSVLDAPKNTFAYEKTSLAILAAKYVHMLANNHPFVDGNKRTAYICMRLFLKLNGKDFSAIGRDKIELMLNIASSKFTVKDITIWLDDRIII